MLARSSNDTVLDDDISDGNDSLTPVNSKMRRSSSSGSMLFIDMARMPFIRDFDLGFNLDAVLDNTRKRISDIKLRTREHLDKYKPRRDLDLLRLQEKLNRSLFLFDARVQRKLQLSSVEKLFYAMSVGCIAALGFIIGKYPKHFPLFHTVLFCLLMPIRFYTYFKNSYQYYLADLCYYVNVLLMLFIWVFPASRSLFVSVFALSMGTLSFAVITWRNSLVLHSIEKTTSSFIHIMPPVTMFVIVHEIPEPFRNMRYPAVARIGAWNFVNGILWTSFYYTVWQAAYHYFITIKRKDQIERGKVTSFTYLKNKNSNSFMGKLVNSLPKWWMQTVAFTLIQFGYQILTMSFCPIWFRYKHACGLFVAFIFIWASYNGATYYVDVFGKRLEKEVVTLRAEVAGLQLENEKLQYSPVSAPQALEDDVTPLP